VKWGGVNFPFICRKGPRPNKGEGANIQERVPNPLREGKMGGEKKRKPTIQGEREERRKKVLR